jgi:hypothetical protein
MAMCKHTWEMTNLRHGFAVFEKCSHCQNIRTYFSTTDTWDEYREGDCTWSIVVNTQTVQFDLHCPLCDHTESYSDLLGLMTCTSCMENCEVERIQKRLESERTWVLVAFGNLPGAFSTPLPQHKLDILGDFFNQRRDISRSRFRFLPSNLISSVPLCRGDFILDIGGLSLEPPPAEQHLFG